MNDLELTMMRRVGELNADLRNCYTAIRVKEDEKARLKAEVERLTKAGDGLYKSMLEIGCNEMADNFQYDAWWDSMKNWNAAKEGKQS